MNIPLVAASLIAISAISLAPQASADGADDQFIAALAAAGIPAASGVESVISYGHRVCGALASGESPAAIANTLATYAYAEDHSTPFDRYQRSYVVFVRVASQTLCPGNAGGASWHASRSWHIVLTGADVPLPPLPQVPDAARLAPPVVVAPAKQTPPPVQKPPPPPQVVVPPAQGAPGGQGKGGTGSGIDGGGTTNGGPAPAPAPEPPEGRITLLP